MTNNNILCMYQKERAMYNYVCIMKWQCINMYCRQNFFLLGKRQDKSDIVDKYYEIIVDHEHVNSTYNRHHGRIKFYSTNLHLLS